MRKHTYSVVKGEDRRRPACCARKLAPWHQFIGATKMASITIATILETFLNTAFTAETRRAMPPKLLAETA